MAAAAAAAAAGIAIVTIVVAAAAVCHIGRHTAACGGRQLATGNELRPFPGPDSYALLYLLLAVVSMYCNLVRCVMLKIYNFCRLRLLLIMYIIILYDSA